MKKFCRGTRQGQDPRSGVALAPHQHASRPRPNLAYGKSTYNPKSELKKLIIRHNLGPISTAKSRLLLLSLCHRLHRSSAGLMMAAFIECLNLPTFSRNLAQYRPSIGPIQSRLSLLLWHPVLKVEEPESGPSTAH